MRRGRRTSTRLLGARPARLIGASNCMASSFGADTFVAVHPRRGDSGPKPLSDDAWRGSGGCRRRRHRHLYAGGGRGSGGRRVVSESVRRRVEPALVPESGAPADPTDEPQSAGIHAPDCAKDRRRAKRWAQEDSRRHRDHQEDHRHQRLEGVPGGVGEGSIHHHVARQVEFKAGVARSRRSKRGREMIDDRDYRSIWIPRQRDGVQRPVHPPVAGDQPPARSVEVSGLLEPRERSGASSVYPPPAARPPARPPTPGCSRCSSANRLLVA